jgi:hypothetical protein
MDTKKKPKRVWVLTPGTKALKSMRLTKGDIKWWLQERKKMDWTDAEMMKHIRTVVGEIKLLFPKTPAKAKGEKK